MALNLIQLCFNIFVLLLRPINELLNLGDNSFRVLLRRRALIHLPHRRSCGHRSVTEPHEQDDHPNYQQHPKNNGTSVHPLLLWASP